MSYKFAFQTLAFFLIWGCSKESSNPKPEAIKLSATSIELTTADTSSLSFTITPSSASGSVTWSSNNTSVAVIDSLGQITATGAGNSVIKASIGSITAYCSIVVNPGIFVAGSQADQNGNNKGIIWRNGVKLYNFGNNTDTLNTYCNDLIVVNGEIFSTGSQNINEVSNAMVWYNNLVLESLNRSNNGAFTSAITTYNGDIFVAGATLNSTMQATIWSSGSSSLQSESNSSCNDITYSNNNQYCVGYTTSTNNNSLATLWINGNATILGDNTASSNAEGVSIEQNNVYVVGQNNGQPVLWENNTLKSLSSSSTYGNATCITTAGGNTYIAGYTINSEGERIPTYWVNMEQKQLADATISGIFNSISILNNTIYLAGYIYDEEYQIATYWTNGTATPLADSGSNSSANSIVVK